jgi:hypothetical protein
MVRLVDRFGRRVAIPTSSGWGNWRFSHPAPPARLCHQCPQLAYFRFIDWDTAVLWSCEDHLPHGIRAYLPNETPNPQSQGVGVACPKCRSTQIKVEGARLSLPNGRSTIRCACEKCLVAWSPLISFGMSDDGATLAADLHRLLESDSSIVEIRVGFTTYRNLCRSLNMGNVSHLRGVPVRSDSELGDLLTYVFSRHGGLEASIDSLEQAVDAQRPTVQFCDSFKPLDVIPGSVWRRNQGLLTCSVLRELAGEVVYQISGSNRVATQSLTEFRRYWMPGEASFPRETSVWIHRETEQCIQVLVATPTQAANQQVHYVTLSGQHETTPLRTFQRLYRELPSPPEDHIWFWEGGLFQAERRGDSVHLQPLSPSTPPAVLRTATLYSVCQPLAFTESTFNVRSGTRWINKQESETSVIVLDIGVVYATPSYYVRFTQADGRLAIEALDAFCRTYEYPQPPAPCRKGETWVSLDDSTRQCIILKEDEAHLSQATVEWRDGRVEVLPHERLIAEYSRLDVRSYWQMLDNDDED